jgi:hypothetical protein
VCYFDLVKFNKARAVKKGVNRCSQVLMLPVELPEVLALLALVVGCHWSMLDESISEERTSIYMTENSNASICTNVCLLGTSLTACCVGDGYGLFNMKC